MTGPDPDAAARRLAGQSLAAADPTGWFERLYSEAAVGDAVVPWDRGHPQPLLVEWGESARPAGAGRRALVVGCGFGDDAEYVSSLGYETVAFDIAETAVRTARSRHPESVVDYLAADLLDPPDEWTHAFDLVVESLTVQSLPIATHPQTTANVSRFVAAGGTLLVIASARDEDEPVDGPPWPLTRAEIEAFAGDGVDTVRIEEMAVPDGLTSSRWRAEFRRR